MAKQTIALAGHLNLEDIRDIPDHCTLDFEHVEAIGFAALRTLLAKQQNGGDIDIVNASDDVFLMFDSTGMRRFIPIERIPLELDMSDYHLSGAGNLGECYFSSDGDSMVKIYSDPELLAMARAEQRGAHAAFINGIPTPISGDEVRVGDERGVVFECAKNKKSFARLIADDPDGIEHYMKVFTDMCLKLHSTPCDPTTAPPAIEIYRDVVRSADTISDEDKTRIERFLDNVPETGTCLHGDLHIGNAIMCDAGPQFIDMGEFAHGNPLFDIAMVCFVGKVATRNSAKTMDLFHITPETMGTCWRLFLKYYFGAETPAEIADIEDEIAPFLGLRLLAINHIHHKDDHFGDLIRANLISRI